MANNRTQMASTDKQAPPFAGGNYKMENSNLPQSGKQGKSRIHGAIQKAKGSTKKSK